MDLVNNLKWTASRDHEQLAAKLGVKNSTDSMKLLAGLCERLQAANVSALSGPLRQSLDSRLKSITDLWRGKSSPLGDRQIQDHDKAIVSFFEFAVPVLFYLYQTTGYEEQQTKTQQALKQAQAELEQISGIVATLKTQAYDSRAQAEAAVRRAEEVRTLTVIAKHSEWFDTDARMYQWASVGWLIIAMLLLGGTAWYGLVTYDELVALAGKLVGPPDPPTTDANSTPGFVLAATVGTRLLVLSVLVSAAVWASRLYRANRHNYVVNRHRHSALGTFEAFLEGVDDNPEVRHAILMEAARAIFTPQPTGYGSAGTEATPPQILEIFRSVASGGKRPAGPS